MEFQSLNNLPKCIQLIHGRIRPYIQVISYPEVWAPDGCDTLSLVIMKTTTKSRGLLPLAIPCPSSQTPG